jgi:DNA-binding cell septation regulator SpoVG
MPTETRKCDYVERLQLAQEIDKKVAWASVRIGEVLIHGISVWRGGNGGLRVFFPSYKLGLGLDDAVELPAELRSQVEADVISAYKAAKSAERERQERAEGD